MIIGGGQAGLGLSYCLTQMGREHLMLERGRIAERWRSERWDSLTVVIFAGKSLPFGQQVSRGAASALMVYGVLVVIVPEALPTMMAANLRGPDVAEAMTPHGCACVM